MRLRLTRRALAAFARYRCAPPADRPRLTALLGLHPHEAAALDRLWANLLALPPSGSWGPAAAEVLLAGLDADTGLTNQLVKIAKPPTFGAVEALRTALERRLPAIPRKEIPVTEPTELTERTDGAAPSAPHKRPPAVKPPGPRASSPLYARIIEMLQSGDIPPVGRLPEVTVAELAWTHGVTPQGVVGCTNMARRQVRKQQSGGALGRVGEGAREEKSDTDTSGQRWGPRPSGRSLTPSLPRAFLPERQEEPTQTPLLPDTVSFTSATVPVTGCVSGHFTAVYRLDPASVTWQADDPVADGETTETETETLRITDLPVVREKAFRDATPACLAAATGREAFLEGRRGAASQGDGDGR